MAEWRIRCWKSSAERLSFWKKLATLLALKVADFLRKSCPVASPKVFKYSGVVERCETLGWQMMDSLPEEQRGAAQLLEKAGHFASPKVADFLRKSCLAASPKAFKYWEVVERCETLGWQSKDSLLERPCGAAQLLEKAGRFASPEVPDFLRKSCPAAWPDDVSLHTLGDAISPKDSANRSRKE